jgi:tetratricopeptide (TPR) repeat protein/predicted Ser/Thr protein kinase
MQAEGSQASEPCLGTETLAFFLEGRADPAVRARVEQHASRCASCRKIMSALARCDTPATVSLTPMPRVGGVHPPGTRVGRYLIEREIGAGGMGVVYAARDLELDRVVALKLVRGDSSASTPARLRREAQAMAQVAHPNVVAVYDVGAFEDRIFIAMEYVAGQTLARWANAPLSQREILDAYRAAGRGLAAAHAAGIVHRDFKPENVFVGSNGRVLVGDFGLARTPVATGAAPSSAFAASVGPAAVCAEAATPPVMLTAPGALLGTPYYMAPELYTGADADARSDQFSFCVALFTTLYGERPFDGDTLASLVDNMHSGRLRVPRISPRPPKPVHAAICRGLAADPAKRFASLDELLRELAPTSHRWARRMAGLVAGVLVSVAIVAAIVEVQAGPPAATDQRCSGARAEFAKRWNPERRAAIASAFAASQLPFAATVLAQVTTALDRYAETWAQAHTEACRATRILGQQTEAELEARMICLEQRLQGASALIDTLAAPASGAVARSVAAVTRLPAVAECADLPVLRQIIALPTDAVARARLGELMQRLSIAAARYNTGSFAQALELTSAVVPEAHTLGYLPFEAQAELQQGSIEATLGLYANAERSLMAAAWSAEAGRNDVVAARVWTVLVSVVGNARADYARARTLVPRATAAIARIGGNAEIESVLHRVLGAMAFDELDLDAAQKHLETAVALGERASGPESLVVADSLDELAHTLLEQGRASQAIALAQREHAIVQKLLGTDHPHIVFSLDTLGEAHAALGDDTAAERELRRALALGVWAYSPDNPVIVPTLSELAGFLRRHGRVPEALVMSRRAVALIEKELGPDHPALIEVLVRLGLTLGQLGRHAEADEQLRRAEAVASKAFGVDHARVMSVVAARGELRILQSRWRDAVALYEKAIPALEKSRGRRVALADAWSGLCRAYVELQQPDRALALLARKLEALDTGNRATIEFTLARALWLTGGDRKRARALAEDALTVDRAEAGIYDAAEIRRWLTSHRPE